MKRIIALALLMAFTTSTMADQLVRGYVKKDGTYVEPHYRSSPNGQQWDNYSTKGNSNPYTLERGTQRDTTYDIQPQQRYDKPSNGGGFN